MQMWQIVSKPSTWPYADQPGNFSLRGGGETASLDTGKGNIVVKTLQQLWDDLQPLKTVDLLVVDVDGYEECVLAFYKTCPIPSLGWYFMK